MPWWDTSAAFALYGVVVGGTITASVTTLGNRHGSAVAKSERESLAVEADRNRRHEIDLDRIRSVRAARERVYPGMAEAIQDDASHAIADAREALNGNPPLAGRNNQVFEAREAGKAWANMIIYATQRIVDDWDRFLMAETALDAVVKTLRIARDSPEGATPTQARAHEEATKALNALSEAMELLYQHMREDLTSPEDPG